MVNLPNALFKKGVFYREHHIYFDATRDTVQPVERGKDEVTHIFFRPCSIHRHQRRIFPQYITFTDSPQHGCPADRHHNITTMRQRLLTLYILLPLLCLAHSVIAEEPGSDPDPEITIKIETTPADTTPLPQDTATALDNEPIE